MRELIPYGGACGTRREVYQYAREVAISKGATDDQADASAERAAMMPEEITAGLAARRGLIPIKVARAAQGLQ